jgi:membrane associated rhomboid family serine protease
LNSYTNHVCHLFLYFENIFDIFQILFQSLDALSLQSLTKKIFEIEGSVVFIYFGGVIAGSLGVSIIKPSFFLMGSSGGIFAIIAAYIAFCFLVKIFFNFFV